MLLWYMVEIWFNYRVDRNRVYRMRKLNQKVGHVLIVTGWIVATHIVFWCPCFFSRILMGLTHDQHEGIIRGLHRFANHTLSQTALDEIWVGNSSLLVRLASINLDSPRTCRICNVNEIGFDWRIFRWFLAKFNIGFGVAKQYYSRKVIGCPQTFL